MDFTFIDLKPISAADNCTFRAVGKGMMRVTIPNGNQPTVVHLKDVRLYVPTIAFTLVLLSRADSAGYTTVIKDGDLHLLDRNHGDMVIGRIPAKDGLWSVAQKIKALEDGQDPIPGNSALSAISLMDLHQCLSHISPSAAIKLIDDCSLDGIMVRDRNIDFCEVCALAKIKHLPFRSCAAIPLKISGTLFTQMSGAQRRWQLLGVVATR